MTLTTMMTFIRRRLDDATSTRWTDANLTAELNAAYEHVTADIDLISAFPRNLIKTQTLSVVAGTLAYALNSDFQTLRHAIWTDPTPNIECREISYDDYPDYTEAGAVFDVEGRPLFYLSTNTTPVHTFNFAYDPGRSMTIVVTYLKTPTALSGGSDVPDLDPLLHPLLPLHVCSVVPDSLDRDAAMAEYQLRKQQAISFVRRDRRNQFVKLDGAFF